MLSVHNHHLPNYHHPNTPSPTSHLFLPIPTTHSYILHLRQVLQGTIDTYRANCHIGQTDMDGTEGQIQLLEVASRLKSKKDLIGT